MANFGYDAYRNSLMGKTSDYSTRVDADSDTLVAFFSDDATVTPLVTHVFQSSYTASENPAFGSPTSRQVLTGVTAGTLVGGAAAVGTVDAVDAVFTSGTILTGSTSVESLIICKFITNAAASPLLVHFDTATGLPLTPNGADVTVVWNASGIWKV